MYAIVEIAGQQFKVEKDQRLFVHRLEGKKGSSVKFDQVLLIDNSGKIKVGSPLISGASVSAKILEHLKDDKVIVFKKKRRKGYQVKNGHRQFLSQILIEKIQETGAKKKAAPKKEDKPEVPEVKKAEKVKTAKATTEKPKAKEKSAKAKEKTAKAKPATKKPTAEKTAAKVKKTVAKKPAAKKKAAPKKESKKEE